MASVSSKKKRKEDVSDEESEEESSSSEDDEESESDVDPNMEVQVEFEARSLSASDFNGIKRLLQQLLLKSHINLSEITELILSQSKVGSVIKCITDETDEDEDEDDDEAYGICTVLNLSQHKDAPSIQDFIKHVMAKCQDEKFLKILKDKQQTVGWLISERFINIPAHIAPPLYASLRSEIMKANIKGKPFQFDYLLYMCKSYELDQSNRKKKKKKNAEPHALETEGRMFINGEDEILVDKAVATFEYDVSEEGDVLVSRNWKENDSQMRPSRTTMLIPWSQMENIITEMEQYTA